MLGQPTLHRQGKVLALQVTKQIWGLSAALRYAAECTSLLCMREVVITLHMRCR